MNKGGDQYRFGPEDREGHAEVVRRPRKTPDTMTKANAKSVVPDTVEGLLAEIDNGVAVAA